MCFYDSTFNLKLSEIDRNRQILSSKDIFSLLKKIIAYKVSFLWSKVILLQHDRLDNYM